MLNKLPVYFILTIALIIALIGIYLFCYNLGRISNPVRMYNQKNRLVVTPHQKRRIIYGLTLSLILVLLGGGFFSNIIKKADNAGAINETKGPIQLSAQNWLRDSYGTFKYNQKRSFIKRMPRPNQRNILIVLYRYSCPACHAIHTALPKEMAKQHLTKNVYYVPSRSKYGYNLAKKAGINFVPTLVYIKPNGGYYSSGLYIKGENAKNYHLNRGSISYYGHLLKQNKK